VIQKLKTIDLLNSSTKARISSKISRKSLCDVLW